MEKKPKWLNWLLHLKRNSRSSCPAHINYCEGRGSFTSTLIEFLQLQQPPLPHLIRPPPALQDASPAEGLVSTTATRLVSSLPL
ncbi:unnamed protein product [Linum tenue]|uniref:Uncharacterized protein n=1 Tax=Linum tenue TaxID=586396 RepID=A0AAV0NWI0_9ROSI|nr:unnamed protein product [Linum tenue]